jgi:hypothetical protein
VFLMSHHPQDVIICCNSFLRPSTAHLFLGTVERFSVKMAKCYNDADRTILDAKVNEYYLSEESFEEYAKTTSIGLIAVTLMRMYSHCVVDVLPWIALARKLGYDKIADALSSGMHNYDLWRLDIFGETKVGVLGAAGMKSTVELDKVCSCVICHALLLALALRLRYLRIVIAY